ncbi:MAG: hypothetical protein CMJ29_09245 [Phycisphaerae bacterium]|nr:hypothetical protein [Phycisphaerae bacterium]
MVKGDLAFPSVDPDGSRSPHGPNAIDVSQLTKYAKANADSGILSNGSTLGVQGSGLPDGGKRIQTV